MPNAIIYKPTDVQFQPFPTRRFVDYTNQQFERLTVLGYAGLSKSRHATWWCQCQCGNIIRTEGGSLRTGNTTSCGCKKYEGTHGHFRNNAPTPEYRSYWSAKKRCEDPKNDSYMYYGGIGIEFRFQSFEDFFAELGYRPSPSHSVDRIDRQGHYESGNVRWATSLEQARNRRNTRIFIIQDKQWYIREIAEHWDIPLTRLSNRIRAQWCNECLILPYGSTCVHREKSSPAT